MGRSQRSGRRKGGGTMRKGIGLLVAAGVGYVSWLGYSGGTGAEPVLAAGGTDGGAPPLAGADAPRPSVTGTLSKNPISVRLNATAAAPARAPAVIRTPKGRVPGAAAMTIGEFAAAAAKLEAHLATDGAKFGDEARWRLGRCYFRLGRGSEAAARFQEVIDRFPNSPFVGDALVGLADVATAANDAETADRRLVEAFTKHSRTRGGAVAALRLADRWHEKFVVQNEKKSRWSEIRDAYSVALRALDEPGRRAPVIERLKKLNEYVVFGAGAKKEDVTIHLVAPGDVLSRIARRYKVEVGSIMRVNGIRRANLIRIGQKLRILKGPIRILVDKTHLRLTLSINDRFLKEYPVGIGPDDATPAGTFTITTKIKDPMWYPSGGSSIPAGDPRNILGARWMGFDRAGKGAGLGIHGTTKPQSVPGRESAGCIRMLNEHVEELFDWLPRGTQVTVVE